MLICVTQNLIEEQLSDGRQWLLDTESVGLADISAHFLLNWALGFKHLKELFDKQAFPNAVAVSIAHQILLLRSNCRSGWREFRHTWPKRRKLVWRPLTNSPAPMPLR